jgi:hypothetical protein
MLNFALELIRKMTGAGLSSDLELLDVSNNLFLLLTLIL